MCRCGFAIRSRIHHALATVTRSANAGTESDTRLCRSPAMAVGNVNQHRKQREWSLTPTSSPWCSSRARTDSSVERSGTTSADGGMRSAVSTARRTPHATSPPVTPASRAVGQRTSTVAVSYCRVVHLSSIRAYGDLGYPDDVDESWPLRPDGSAYVDTKVASEAAAFAAHAGGEVPVTVVRPGDVYGPGSRPWTLIPLEEARRGRLILPARGKGIFSPIYVDDLMAGIFSAATHPDAAGHVFNLTGPVPVTCAEFFGHFTRMLRLAPPRAVPTSVALVLAQAVHTVERLGGRSSELNAETVRYLTRTGGYSRRKAERFLGWVPKVSLDDGMAMTEQWLRAEGLLGSV